MTWYYWHSSPPFLGGLLTQFHVPSGPLQVRRLAPVTSVTQPIHRLVFAIFPGTQPIHRWKQPILRIVFCDIPWDLTRPTVKLPSVDRPSPSEGCFHHVVSNRKTRHPLWLHLPTKSCFGIRWHCHCFVSGCVVLFCVGRTTSSVVASSTCPAGSIFFFRWLATWPVVKSKKNVNTIIIILASDAPVESPFELLLVRSLQVKSFLSLN